MKHDLLRLLADEREITNVIVLTHNIDFVFVQNLVLNALARCGSPSLTIFADASCAAETFSLQEPLLANLGTRYRVVPVAMAHGFHFHPKAVLLAGRKSARLLVGSGNLTFSGWRENGEIWVRFRSEDGTAEFAAFKSYLDQLVRRLALNDTLKSEVEEAFDPTTRAWAQDLDEPAGLVGRVGAGPPLVETMKATLGERPCDSLVVVSPYFDEQARALVGLHDALGPRETVAYLDPKHTNFSASAAKGCPENLKLRSAWVERSDGKGHRRCFLHAKIYAVERGDEILALIGSANCSQAALAMTGDRGNAELLAAVRLDKEEFDALIKSELKVSADEDLDLPATMNDPERTIDPSGPVLLAVRAHDDVLKLAHTHAEGFCPNRAVLGDVTVEALDVGQGTCECLCPVGTTPRVVSLEGEWRGSHYKTPPLWVDHERHLLSTAYRRSLEDTVRRKARQAEWGIGEWRQVLEVLCQDLEYSRPGQAIPTGRRRNGEQGVEENVFTREDLFSRDLRLDFSQRDERHVVPPGSASLQALLLRWFGHEPSIDKQSALEDSPESQEDAVAADDHADEAVDQVEQIVIHRLSPEKEKARTKQEERDRNKARKIVEQMAALMASPGYLKTRRLEDLGRDLQLAAVLLRLGSTKGWIEHEEVLSMTHRVWTSLFLSAEGGDTEGWLQRRWKEDPIHSQQALARPAVTAALFVWSLEIPSEPRSPRDVQMLLSLALSVARHPWLWLSADQAAVAQEVEALLVASTDPWNSDSIASRWLSLQSLGRELGFFEDTVRLQGMSRLRELNLQEALAVGELVWQGALGYCVLKEPASREEKKNVEVLLIQTGTSEGVTKVLRSDLLNPVRGLANSAAVLEEENMQSLVEFLGSLSRGVA